MNLTRAIPLMVSLACLIGGCCSYGYSVVTDAGSSGSVLESESSSMAMLIDGGQGTVLDLGPGFENAIADSFILMFTGAPSRTQLDCIEISDTPDSRLTISMECPSGTGTFALADLGASVCDASNTCAELEGMIEVTEFTPDPNDVLIEGSIDATLDLTVAADGGGPFISGVASVWVAASSQTAACPSGLTGGG